MHLGVSKYWSLLPQWLTHTTYRPNDPTMYVVIWHTFDRARGATHAGYA